MNVTAYELKTRCGELIERAAAGEEIIITKRGVVKAKMVPMEHFDSAAQKGVLDRMKRIKGELARKGVKVTREEMKSAIEEGRL